MPVMQIRIVRMAMHHPSMPVRMRVRLFPVPLAMRMPVMFIVNVLVAVLERLVHMRMLVPLGEVQSHADGHQRGSDPEKERRVLAQKEKRERRAEKGRNREVRSGPRGTEIS